MSKKDTIVVKFVGFGEGFCCRGRLNRRTGSFLTAAENLLLPWSWWCHFLCFDKLQVVLNWAINFSQPLKDQPTAFEPLTSWGRETRLETHTVCFVHISAESLKFTGCAWQSDLNFLIAWDGAKEIAAGGVPGQAVPGTDPAAPREDPNSLCQKRTIYRWLQ